MRGRRVLVTGATGGLGPTVVAAFLGQGAEVLAAARRRTRLDELRAGLANHDRLHVAEGDASDPEGVEALFDAVTRESPLDVVVHCVGAFAYGALAEMDDATVAALISGNITASALVLRAALRRMVPAGRGSVVLVAADRAERPEANFALYGAAKAAVCHLVSACAEEAQPAGVRVNVLLPGVIDTDENRAAMPTADRSTWTAPVDIAKAALWLAGDEAGAVTGARMKISGGQRAGGNDSVGHPAGAIPREQ